jgi:hypothetical protein
MNRSEVADLLALIEGFERRPFPANAVDAWLAVMARVEYRDAAQAVTEAFDTAEPLKTPVQPGQIKRRAVVIRENRERVQGRAIEAPSSSTRPNEAYLRARAELARRIGDPARLSPRSPARADTSQPVSTDSGITNDARNRAASALRAYAAA